MPGHTPLEEHPVSAAVQYLRYCKCILYCAAYIVISGCLIRFNKLVMKDHFPHAVALSTVHMIVCSVFCSTLYMFFPSMFPGMEVTKGQRLGLLKWFVPIGCCFAVTLVGSNQAYAYCSVTFLQFMKEANVMLVFIISCAIGLQSFTRLRGVVIVWVIVGASSAVSGEVQFKWVGFFCQALSQLAEVSRMIMGEIVLSGRKLDPLTYNMFVAPICLVVLAIANAVHWSPGTLEDFRQAWPLLFASACMAFCLNIAVAAVIKECSAVGFVLAGLAKDIVIVLSSACLFNEHVTTQQGCAFLVTILGVFFWSYMKIYPTSAPVRALESLLCMPPPCTEGETLVLTLRHQPSAAEKHV